MQKTLCTLLAILLIGGASLKAQNMPIPSSGLGVGMQVGINNLAILPKAETSMGPSIGINGRYNYFFNNTFGVTAGVNLTFGTSTLNVSKIASDPVLTTIMSDDERGEFESTSQYHCLSSDVIERYNKLYLEVPLLFVIQGDLLEKTIKQFHTCYLGLGAKVAVPLMFKAHCTYGESTMTLGPNVVGTGVKLDKPMPWDSYYAPSNDYDVKSATSTLYIMASMEAGTTLTFNDGGAVQVGIYVDYAINHSEMENPDNAQIVVGSNDHFTTTGYLLSNHTDKFKMFQVGLIGRYMFPHNKD